MPKATDADKERFRSLVPEAPGVEVKPMFGQLGAFVNGNMFAGLFGSAVGVKLDESGADALSALARHRPVRPRGAADGRLPLAPRGAGGADAATWVDRAPRARVDLPAEEAQGRNAT